MTLGGVFTGGESSWWRGDHNQIRRKLSVLQFVFIHSAYYFLVILCVGEFACGRIHWLPLVISVDTVTWFPCLLNLCQLSA